MLLESALFLHPHIASALVGQMAQGVTKLAKWEGKKIHQDVNEVKQTFNADDDGPEPIPNEIDGNGDEYDPWACEEDGDCPTEPFEYKCVNGRCVPVLPELVISDQTMRNVMADQFQCWTAIGGMQRWCKSIYPKIWPRSTYPEYSYTLAPGEEYEREVTNRSGKPNADIIRNSVNVFPESGNSYPYYNTSEQNNVLNNIKSVSWFGNVMLDTLPFTAQMAEDSDDWEFWLGGPLVWTGLISGGMVVNYQFQPIKSRGAGAKPHQFFNQIPSSTPEDERDGFYGMGPVSEEYLLSRNGNDYGWGEWITGDWYKECGGSLFAAGGRKVVVCCTVDCRCFFRVRYKATIVPDPKDSRFIDTNKGQISGALYGRNSVVNGVQNHTLKLEIEGQDTSGQFNTSFKPAAGDEYVVKIFKYGETMPETRTVYADEKGKAIFAYEFPDEGLYQFTVDHALSGNGCIVNQPSSLEAQNEFFNTVSPYFINFGVFVNPPPPKRGCTIEGDLYYDANAVIDDGSCLEYNGFNLGGNDTPNTGTSWVNNLIPQRFVDQSESMVKGVAVASAVFLGLVFFASKGGNE